MKYIKSKMQALLLILVIFTTQNLMGQRGRHHHPNMMAEIEALKEDLNLSEAQSAQIDKLQADFKTQIEAIKADESKEWSEKRAAMKTLRDNQKVAVEEILTNEQNTLLAERKATHQAERSAKMEERKANGKALRRELKAYHTENIAPVILTQRAKLEKSLSEEDKVEIAKLRTAFAAKKLAKQEEIEKRKAERKANGEKGSPHDRKAKMEDRKAGKLARENDEDVRILKALVEKYESNIEVLYVEIESQKTEWEAAQKKIIQQFKEENGMGGGAYRKGHHTMEGHKKGRRGGLHRKGDAGRHRHHEGRKGKMKKGHFLLLDPTQATQNGQATALTQIKIYPNPATSSNTLDYEVKEAGRIKIEIHDAQGRLVRVLLDEEKSVGQYQLNMDLSTLKNRTYFYVVSDKQGVTTKKFLILEK